MAPLATPPGVESICRNVLVRTLRMRRGENLLVESWTHMLPWANAFVLEARRLGIRTTLLYEEEATYWRAVEECKPKELGQFPEPELGALSKADGYVFLWGPEDRPRLRALPKEKFDALVGYNSKWYQAAEKAGIRGCRIELGQATDPAARFYGVNAAVWQQNLLDAMEVDVRSIARDAARLAARLRKGKTLHVSHANGTNVQLRLAGRKPVVDSGIVTPEDVRAGNNMTTVPAGAVYVAPDEKFIEGNARANRPSYPTKGMLGGGEWSFSENRLASFHYESGEDRFTAAYEAAPAHKDRIGFVSIGLNPKLHLAPGIEDFERGTVLLGIGSNGAFGGKNRIPFQSWLVLAGAHVDVDGTPIVADGEIL
ncbi:MAG: hypothetical protein L3J93_01870 [Thermoplasmata archaeon]|nr:hypothetical protein [Thermoplasmata archaeon]